MYKIKGKLAKLITGALIFLLCGTGYAGLIKGIYINQETMQDTKQLSYLVNRAKKVGIQTFIVDLELPSSIYQKNVALLKNNGIHYVARIIVFPGGGTSAQIHSESYREKKLKLAKTAIAYGAEQIQLDYIRYSSKQPPSEQNAKDILKIIAWFKERLPVPLQIDVFGISSFGPSKWIGQDIKLFSSSVNAICPMVYPSHYEPFKAHAVTPYETVYQSLMALRGQFHHQPLPFKLIPYIEQSNYRYPLSRQKKLSYLYSQIQAAENANADGWYVWSPHNYYDTLFNLLESRSVK